MHISQWLALAQGTVSLFLVSFCRVYWPLFVLIFYILSPVPTFISRRLSDDTDSSSNACRELAYFLTTGIVVSCFGLPIILARTSTVSSLSTAAECTGVRFMPAEHCGNQIYFGLIPDEFLPPTDPVGCLWPGDDRKRCHLPHHLWLFCCVWWRGRL